MFRNLTSIIVIIKIITLGGNNHDNEFSTNAIHSKSFKLRY